MSLLCHGIFLFLFFSLLEGTLLNSYLPQKPCSRQVWLLEREAVVEEADSPQGSPATAHLRP